MEEINQYSELELQDAYECGRQDGLHSINTHWNSPDRAECQDYWHYAYCCGFFDGVNERA